MLKIYTQDVSRLSRTDTQRLLLTESSLLALLRVSETLLLFLKRLSIPDDLAGSTLHFRLVLASASGSSFDLHPSAEPSTRTLTFVSKKNRKTVNLALTHPS